MFLSVAIGAPIVQPAFASAVPVLETLRDPSVETQPGSAYWFPGGGGAVSVVARTGSQSANLARGGASPTPTGELGVVEANATHAVSLLQLRSAATYYHVPTTPPRAASLQPFFRIDVDAEGTPEECAVAAATPLARTSTWTLLDFDATYAWTVGGPACDGTGAAMSIADLQADPAYAAARVGSLSIRTIVSGTAPWPTAAPLLVDDLALRATSSTLVRIREAALNTCDGASFDNLQVAVDCAVAGATILVGPGTAVGSAIIDKQLLVCGSDALASECGSSGDDAIVRGTSVNAVTITAANVELRDLTIENPTFAGTGAVEPTLVLVQAADVRLVDLRLRDPAAPLALAEWRQATRAIAAADGAARLHVDGVDVARMRASVGTQATCGAAPCVTFAIDARGVGTDDLTVTDSTIDLSGAHPAVGIRASDDGLTATGNLILTPGRDGAHRLSAGIESGAVANALTGWLVQSNTIETAPSATRLFSTGIDAALSGAQLIGNTIRDQDRGILLAHATGAGDNRVADNQIFDGAEGLRSLAPRTDAERNVMRDNGFALVLGGDGGALGSSAGTKFHNSTFVGGDKALRILAQTQRHEFYGRDNDWGLYGRGAIRLRIQDDSFSNFVDYTCYVDEDGTTRICPPTPAFTWSPTTPIWNKTIQFINTSAANGRPIISHVWQFGDGNSSAQRDPSHVYAAPGVYDVTLTVADLDGTRATIVQPVAVSNTPPTLQAIGDKTIGEGSLLVVRMIASDADGDALTYSVDPLPEGAAFNASNRTFTWVPSFTQEGTYSVSFRVSDQWDTTTRTVTILVTHVNGPPVIVLHGNTTGPELSTMRWMVTATDPDGDLPSLSAFVMPQGASFIDHRNGSATFTWTPAYTDAGTRTLTVQATDGVSVGRLTLQLVILNTNRAPVWSTPPPQVAREDEPYALIISASDPDGDVLTYRAMEKPLRSVFDPTTRRFTWTPTFTHAGTHRLVFRASDAETSTDLVVNLVVQNTNRLPTAIQPPDQTVKANRTLTVTLQATDPDGESMTWSSPDAPAGVGFAGSTLQWRPLPAQMGNHTMRLVAQDPYGGTSETSITISVTENLAPAIVLTYPAMINVSHGVGFSSLSSYDPDGTGQLSVSWDFDARNGIGYDRHGPSFLWTFQQPGDYVVTVRVVDVDGMTSITNVTVHVDDLAYIDVTVDEQYKLAGDYAAHVLLRMWNGTPVASQRVDYVITYEANPTAAWTMRTGHFYTDENGRGLFVIERDAVLFNVPGTHRITVTARVADTMYGDTEVATDTATYGRT